MGPLICIQNFTELPQTQPSTLSQKAGLWMFVWEKSGIAFPVASFCLISKSSFNSEYFCMCGGYMWGCVCACVCSEMSEVDRVSSHSLPVLWGRLSHCTWSLLPLFSPPTKLDCSQQAPMGSCCLCGLSADITGMHGIAGVLMWVLASERWPSDLHKLNS